MRASDILESMVFDADGRKVGQVHDIRMVRTGPVQGVFGPAYVAQGLVVGPAALGVRLGFDRSEMAGPAVLKRLFEWAHRNARFVDWSHIDSIGANEIRISAKLVDLPEVPQR
jgi:hypothetical protein